MLIILIIALPVVAWLLLAAVSLPQDPAHHIPRGIPLEPVGTVKDGRRKTWTGQSYEWLEVSK